MHLPNAEAGEIAEDKIIRYLLSSIHPMGRSKAAFFGKHGFGLKQWRILAQALRRHAADNVVAESEETRFGTRYVVDGAPVAPDGAALNVRSVWFINSGSRIPRFVTAHPLKRNSP